MSNNQLPLEAALKAAATLLNLMDVPTFKRDLTNPNILWLLAKLRERNAKHVDYCTAMERLLSVAEARRLLKGRDIKDYHEHINSVRSGEFFKPPVAALLKPKPVTAGGIRAVGERIRPEGQAPALKPYQQQMVEALKNQQTTAPITVRKPGPYDSTVSVLRNASEGIHPERRPLVVKPSAELQRWQMSPAEWDRLQAEKGAQPQRQVAANPALGAPYGKQGTTTGRIHSYHPANGNRPKPNRKPFQQPPGVPLDNPGEGSVVRAPQLRRNHPDVQTARDARHAKKEQEHE